MAAPSSAAIRTTCFIGGPSCGKSNALADRARDLIASGEHDVIAICASPARASALTCLLDARGAEEVEVLSCQDLAQDIVAGHEAPQRLRILRPIEERMLLEDIRVCGIKRKRLKTLVAFLNRSWSDLADSDPAWLITDEERIVVDLIHDALAFTGGILPGEASNRAIKALACDEPLRMRHTRRHVLVDDYHLMSAATQYLVGSLALQSITLTAGITSSAQSFEPYPHARGAQDFIDAHPDARIVPLNRCYRPRAIVTCLSRLQGARIEDAVSLQAASDVEGAVCTQMETGFSDECRAIVKLVRDERDRGTALRDILVVGTDAVWRKSIARALQSCSIPATCIGPNGIPHGDLQDEARWQHDIASTLAQLARHPDDSLAWRTWCGLGDYVGRSVAITALRSIALPQHLPLGEALHQLATGSLAGADPHDPALADLAMRYREGLRIIDADRARQPQQDPRLPDGGETHVPSVYVCSPAEARGRRAKLVIFGGFINGFIPSRDYFDASVLVGGRKADAYRNALIDVSAAAACATDTLVFTGFTSCSLETAERLNLHIERIRLKNGVPTAFLAPSIMLDVLESGGAAPIP